MFSIIKIQFSNITHYMLTKFTKVRNLQGNLPEITKISRVKDLTNDIVAEE